MTIIEWCADRLMIDIRPRTDITRDSLVNGLRALHTFSLLWGSKGQVTQALCDVVDQQLQTLSDTTRKDLDSLFRALIVVPDIGWARFDEDAVEKKSCRMSLLLWALKPGPRGFLMGWKNGKTAVEIMKHEEDKIDNLIDNTEFTRPYFDEMLLKLKSKVH